MKAAMFFGLFLVLVAAILSIVGTAIPYWVSHKESGADVHYGLWKACGGVQKVNTCVNFGEDEIADWFKAVRAMVILGILSLCACFLFILLYAKYDTSRLLSILSLGFAMIGGICCIIGVSVFGAKESDVRSYFASGFYLVVAAGILAFIAIIALAIARRAPGYASM